MRSFKLFVIFAFGFFGFFGFLRNAYSIVNLTTGQYHKSYDDFVFDKQGMKFKLWRAYNSSQKSSGLFGWGWCSNLDYRLNIKKNRIDLSLCGRAETRFNKVNKGVYVSKNKKLILKNNEYIYKNNSTTKMVFGSDGKLVKILPSGVRNSYLLVEKTPSSIKVSLLGAILDLRLRSGLVSSIRWKKKKIFTATYKKGLLSFFDSLAAPKTSLRYDRNKRLTHIYGRKKFEIKYNKFNLVKGVVKGKYCYEKYRYKPNKARNQMEIFTSNNCRKKVLSNGHYLVQFDRNGKAKKYQNKLTNKEVKYNSKSGKPIEIRTNRFVKKLDYDKKNNVRRFDFSSGSQKFFANIKYTRHGKVKQIVYKNNLKSKKNLKKVDLHYAGKKLKSVTVDGKKKIALRYNKQNLPAIIQSKKGTLSYKYGKSRTLKSVKLKTKNKKSYQHIVGSKKNKSDGVEIGRYLSSLYGELGSLYSESYLLRGVFP